MNILSFRSNSLNFQRHLRIISLNCWRNIDAIITTNIIGIYYFVRRSHVGNVLKYRSQELILQKLAFASTPYNSWRWIFNSTDLKNGLFKRYQEVLQSRTGKNREVLKKQSLNQALEIYREAWNGYRSERNMNSNEDVIVSDLGNSELDSLLAEYFILRITENISVKENERQDEILELAIVDEELEEEINKIDELVYRLQKTDFKLLNHNQSSYGIEDFLNELLRGSRNGNYHLEPKEFDNIARKLTFTPEMVQRYIIFQKDGYCRKIVFSNDNVCVYIISWMPNQTTPLHTHEFSFCSTYIYQGVLTIEEFPSQEDSEQGRITEYKEGEWAFSPSNTEHQLSNNTSENLVTIHYRYFKKDPKECEQLMPSCYKRDRNQDLKSVSLA